MPLHSASAILAAVLSCSRAAPGYPESDEAKVQETLREMTTEEKFLQTCIDAGCAESRARWFECHALGEGSELGGGDSWFVLKDLPRLGVRGMRMRDGPKGLTCQGGQPFGRPCPEDGTSPSFPSQVLRGATWNAELEEEIGRAIGEIGVLLDVHAALLPTINILPWLNWGRAQESYGEDPFFSGKMGAAVVRGVQHDQKVMATAKHFLANNIENTRWWVSAEMDEQTLHDVYLRAWALVVRESAPELVMTSYNRVQGRWPFADPKFISILRDQLGFDGSIMTDWFASWEGITSGRILFHEGTSSPYFFTPPGYMKSNSLYGAGVDMEMPLCNKNRDAVSEAQMCSDAQESCATKRYLDAAVERILRSKSRYGLFGPSRNHSLVSWDNEKFDRLSLRAAQEGMVLLKNHGLLPQAPGVRVAVLGTPETLELGDHGSSAVKPSGRHVTVLQGLQDKFGAENVRHIAEESSENTAYLTSAGLVVIDVGLDHLFEGEFIPPETGGDRKYLTLHAWQEAVIHK
ncbi:cbg-1, partial [Symbiodinium natans]